MITIRTVKELFCFSEVFGLKILADNPSTHETYITHAGLILAVAIDDDIVALVEQYKRRYEHKILNRHGTRRCVIPQHIGQCNLCFQEKQLFGCSRSSYDIPMGSEVRVSYASSSCTFRMCRKCYRKLGKSARHIIGTHINRQYIFEKFTDRDIKCPGCRTGLVWQFPATLIEGSSTSEE